MMMHHGAVPIAHNTLKRLTGVGSTLAIAATMLLPAQERIRWSKDYVYGDKQLVATVSGAGQAAWGWRNFVPNVLNGAAAGGPSGSYRSLVICNNLNPSSQALFALSFYGSDNAARALFYADPTPVPAGQSRAYPLSGGAFSSLPSNFSGSVVIDSDQPAACVVQIEKVGAASSADPGRLLLNESVDDTGVSASLYGSQVVKRLGNSTVGFYYSYLVVQNAEPVPITVTVSYVGTTGAVPSATESVAIPAMSSHWFYSKNNGGLPNGFTGIATVAATGKIAGVAVLYNEGPSDSGIVTTDTAQLQSYNLVSGGSSRLYIPQYVRNYYGYQSGFNAANVGANAVTLTITYTYGGVNYVESLPLGAGQVIARFAANTSVLAPVDTKPQSGRTGSVLIDGGAGSSIVANVNLRNAGGIDCNADCVDLGPQAHGAGGSLNAFQEGRQTANAVIPRFVKMLGSPIFNSGFTILNRNGSIATCTISYPGAGGAAANETVTIGANGGVVNRFAGSGGAMALLPSGYDNAARISCTVPVFVSNNIRADSTSYLGDSTGSSNARNVFP